MSPKKGLGDLVAKATKALGIKPCGGCLKRQQMLNDSYTKYVPERLRERLGLTTKGPEQGHNE